MPKILSDKDIAALKLKGKKIVGTKKVSDVVKSIKPVEPVANSIKLLAESSVSTAKSSENIVKLNTELVGKVLGALDSVQDKMVNMGKQQASPVIVKDNPKEWLFKISRDDLGYIQTIRATEV